MNLNQQASSGVQPRQNAPPFVGQGQFTPAFIPQPSRPNAYNYPQYNAYNAIAPIPRFNYNPMRTPWNPYPGPPRIYPNSYMGPTTVPYAIRVPPATNKEIKQSPKAIKIIDPTSGRELLANKDDCCTPSQSSIPTSPDVNGARETSALEPGQIKQPRLHENWPRAHQELSADTVDSSPRNTLVIRSHCPLPSPPTGGAGCSLPKMLGIADRELHNMEVSQVLVGSQSSALHLPNKNREASSSGETQHSCQDTTTAENFKRLIRLVQDLTECPVCYEALSGDLIQCKNGHALCESCATYIDNCPSCGEAFTIQKSSLLGQILERLPKPCPFSCEGCEHILFENEDHSSFCKYRPTSCKNDLCKWEGCTKDLIDHVKECFKGTGLCLITFPNIKITQTRVINPAKEISCYVPIVFESEIFWMYFHRSRSSKRMSHKFYHIPISKPTQKYYFIVSFAKGKLGYTCYFNASTDVENVSKSKVDKSGFIFPDSELERFRVPGSKNTYSYTLEIVTEKIV